VVLDILVQQRRDQHAAETFLRRVLAATDSEPRVVITDKLASYPPAIKRVLPNTQHRRHKGLNNRAENSHQSTRHVVRLRIAGELLASQRQDLALGF
jgi:putative transposase